MAKTGFWLKGAKGKLAGTTIYKDANGDTVMREIVTPSNPQTEAQTIQRIVMHTVMQAYSKMKEICDHSFEGMKKGQQCMSLFMKENVQICRAYIAQQQAAGVSFASMFNFVPLGVKGFTPNQYLVSMGSLPEVPCRWIEDNDTTLSYPTIPVVFDNTYAGIIGALGLQRGDQLTFLVLRQTGNRFSQNDFKFSRIILDPITTEGLQAPLSSPLFAEDGSVQFPNPRNEGSFKFTQVEQGLRFQFAETDTRVMIGGAVIVSRKAGDIWRRSTAYLAYPNNITDAHSLLDCINAAKNGASVISLGSEQYLNNAGEGGATGSESGSDSGDEAIVPVVSGATANGNTITVGTPLSIQLASGETSKAVTVAVNFSEVGDGVSVALYKNGTKVGSDEEINSGRASFTQTLEAGTYTIRVNRQNGTQQNPGYSFTIVEYNAGGGSNEGGWEG